MSKLGREILADERAAQARNNVLERYAPWRIGPYVITTRYFSKRTPKRSYVIYSIGQWEIGEIGFGKELFEYNSKREAFRIARRLTKRVTS